MPKTNERSALEVVVDQNTKRIDHIEDAFDRFSGEMVAAITGLRSDMAQRGEKMINMLNEQNKILTKNQTDNQAEIVKNQTDHEKADIGRFAAVDKKITYWTAYVAGGASLCSFLLAIFAIWRHG